MSEMCAQCDAVFGSAADLIAHQKKAHRREDPAVSLETNPEAHVPGLVCSVCGRRFRDARALAAHNLRPHVHDAEIQAPKPAGA